MLEFEKIYADRFVRLIVRSTTDTRMVARTIYTSNAVEFSFASKEEDVDVYEQTLELPEKAFETFNPYDRPSDNTYSFRDYKDAVDYAFTGIGEKEIEKIINFFEEE